MWEAAEPTSRQGSPVDRNHHQATYDTVLHISLNKTVSFCLGHIRPPEKQVG